MHFYMVISLAVFALFVPATVTAHEHESHREQVEKKVATPQADVVAVRGPISMIQAGGGNIGIFSGDDGVFMIDSSYAENNPAVDAAIMTITEQPVKILMNTHWHQDHTGGNAHQNEKGAKLIAHENVYKRLKEGQTITAFDKVVPPAAAEALPEETFKEASEMRLNGHTLKIIPVSSAHTDGDSFVFWPELNVIQTGDLFFNGFWPFIDGSSGGDIYGMIAATDQMLMLADEETRIIPGHGPLANRADLQGYNAMLREVADRVSTAQSQEQSLDQFLAGWPLSDYEEEWGDGFLPTEKFVRIVWDVIQ